MEYLACQGCLDPSTLNDLPAATGEALENPLPTMQVLGEGISDTWPLLQPESFSDTELVVEKFAH